MKNLLFNGLILCVLIVPSLEQFVFNFRTQYDGYIYPNWKPKGSKGIKYYEDAVVVGENFIVLGDGLGGAKGPSGVYSIYQCLNVAQMLSNSTATTAKKLYEEVRETAKAATTALELNTVGYPKNDVATTLVYIKLEGTRLLTGVIGDSGFAVFRFDPKARILKLIFLSNENVRGFNSPYNISPKKVDPANEYEIDVQEGDIVMAFSDGLSDVLPTSFIVAAMNFLMKKMIRRVKFEGKPLDSLDYEYVLGNFVEAYLQNLHEVSMKFLDTILNDIKKINDHQVDIFQDEDPKNLIKIQFEQKYAVDNEKKPILKPQNIEIMKNKFKTSLNQSSNNPKSNVNQQKGAIPTTHKKAQSLAVPPNKNQQQQPIQQLLIQRQQQEDNLKQLQEKELQYVKQQQRKQLTLKNSKSPLLDPQYIVQQQIKEISEILRQHRTELDQLRELQQLKEKQLQQQQLTEEDLETKIKKEYETIFRNEIINNFDPTDSRLAFHKNDVSDHTNNLQNLAHHNLELKNSDHLPGVDGFKNEKVNKTISFDENPTDWNCEHILDLTSPIHSVKDNNKEFPFHNFSECVIKAIPTLPLGIYPEHIPNYFNPRLVERNLPIAVIKIAEDPQFKLDIFLLKIFYDYTQKRVVFSDNIRMYLGFKFTAKNDDVSVAAAAITPKKIFDETKVDPEKNLYETLLKHAEGIKTWYKKSTYIVI